MLRIKNFWVIGGDRRQAALAGLLADDGHGVHTFALEQVQGLNCQQTLDGARLAHCVILPLPAGDGQGRLNAPLSAVRCPLGEILSMLRPGQLVCAGMADEGLRALAREHGVTLRDYFAREELAARNAVATAEGAIQIALEELPITLHEARVLVLGFGRLGQALSPRLRALGARVWVAARSYHQRALAQGMGLEADGLADLRDWLCSFDLLVNTVPAPILGLEELSALKEGALVLDLASRPGGVDWESARALGVHAVHALSLPGKTAPVTAGRYIQETVYHIMEELGV